MQCPSEKGYYTQMVMHSATYTKYFSLAQEFQKHLSNAERKHDIIDQGKYKSGQRGSIVLSRKMMLSKIFQDVLYTNKFPLLTFCGPRRKNTSCHRVE